MALITVTYGAETPGGTITSTKWNQNVADLTNGLSDGTKDIIVANVNASAATLTRLVTAGTATVNNLISSGVITAPSMGTTLANAVFAAFQRTTGTSVTTPNIAISASSGNYTNAVTGSFTDVTNLSVTLVSTGRPVMLMLIDDGTTNGSYLGGTGTLTGAFKRDGTLLGYHSFTSGAFLPPGAMQTIYVETAGSHTYVFATMPLAGGQSTLVKYVKLVAFEL